ncbi:MAG TPA: hypothetical protein VMB18_02395 [Terriglobales bacterium]|nr:hypothetical protein [Terriglobales bacterium]
MDSTRRLWRQLSGRPFGRLVRVFLFRVFHGSGEDSDDLDFGLGLILALLALPGGFSSILLFGKYATILQWMGGIKSFDPLAAAMPDEYFFIVLSMSVAGAVAVWKWEAILPDRRDYMNLVPLPIHTSTIFLANLLAVLFLAGLLAVDVNAASAVLYPTVVSASQQTFQFFFEFAGVHAVTVTLASIFAFLAVFSILGISMAILPPAVFRKMSSYTRGAVVLCLFALLATVSDVPPRLTSLSPNSLLRLLPSAWFLGLCQLLRGRADPAMTLLAHSAILGLAVAPVVATLAFAVGYRRHFLRIPEMSGTGSTEVGNRFGWLGKALNHTIFQTPFQRGSARFVWKTLFRSERHALIMAGLGGWGVVLASQAMLRARESTPVPGDPIISADALSVPLILAFCVIVGMRLAFEIPIELRANWIFRLLLDSDHHESKVVARQTILLAAVPPMILVALPIYVHLGGWTTGLLHTLLVLTWSAILTEALLFRFRKVPFTCALPVFRQHTPVGVILAALGLVFFAFVTSDFEHWALAHPVRMLMFVPWPVGILLTLHHFQSDSTEFDRRLVFEETPQSVFDGLLRLEE